MKLRTKKLADGKILFEYRLLGENYSATLDLEDERDPSEKVILSTIQNFYKALKPYLRLPKKIDEEVDSSKQ
jgi:hypothetical protein